jgi:hypothetical protein
VGNDGSAAAAGKGRVLPSEECWPNHFKVGVVFKDIAFGIENRTDRPVTPQIVLEALEGFCARIRRELGKRAKAPAGAPPGGL